MAYRIAAFYDWLKNFLRKECDYLVCSTHIQETTQLFFVSTALPNSRQIVKFVSRNYARNFMRRDNRKKTQQYFMVIKQSLSLSKFFFFVSFRGRSLKIVVRNKGWLSFTVCGFIELKTAWSHDREILSYVYSHFLHLVSISKYVLRQKYQSYLISVLINQHFAYQQILFNTLHMLVKVYLQLFLPI